MMENLLTAALISVVVFMVGRFVLRMRDRIPGKDARAKVEAGATLLDVRSPGEFAAGSLPGAKNIPVQSLGSRLAELSKERAVVVYCRSGARSARAASVLRSSGFEVYDLGPMGAW